LKDQQYVSKVSYSDTVKVTEIVYEKDNTKIKINYVVKNTNTGISVNNVRNSDITEIVPVLLFYKHSFDCNSVPDDPTLTLNNEMRETMKELKRNKSDLLPDNYHEERYHSLFYNVEQDKLAMQKIRAGIKLYKFLVNHFGTELVRISVIANMIRL